MTTTDIEKIEHLDFKETPPCESVWHEGREGQPQFGPVQPAVAYVTMLYPCGTSGSIFMCDLCLKHLLGGKVRVITHHVGDPCSHPGPHARYVNNITRL